MPDFDKDYYDRFYHNPATRAVSPAEARRQAAFIAAYARYLQVPVKRILDIGCGLGRVLKGLGKEFPSSRLVGVEYSTYLCEKYGWEQGSVEDYTTKPADLVVCNDVLAYLDEKACKRAIANLARLTRGALFVGVISKEDADVIDPERTDAAQHLRTIAWYRRQFGKHFISVGGGFFLKSPPTVSTWAIERL